jgi:DNA-directed RNA polymerase subunit K/omega
MKDIGARTGNVYESLAIISKRANQIHADLKQELHSKLEDFASHSDSLEEIHENREQIEISRFYERLPHPTIISTNEFLESGLEARYND